MFETIVVGYDESPSSRGALRESSLLVKKFGGELQLVHAIPFNEAEYSILPEQHKKRASEADRMLADAQEETRRETGVELQYLVREGEPHEVIVQLAEEKEAKLITLGTYGKKGLKRLLMGSVASQVILHAHCDVLIVKKRCEECTGEYRSFLVPYDGSGYAKKALKRAGEFAAVTGGKIEVLYVIPHYEEMIEFFKSEPMKEMLRKEAEKIMEDVDGILSPSGVPFTKEIMDGHTAEEIVHRVQKNGIDLVVMGTHGWKGFSKAIMGSTTRRVITHVATPVLVVK